MDWLQENLLTLITTVFGGVGLGGYIFERNKRKIEEKQASAEALETMQKAYDKFTEDSLKRYESVTQEVKELKEEVGFLQIELVKEKGKFAVIKEENENLKRQYAQLTADYEILKSQFEKYKKEKTK